jgi:hypothetical protein
MLARDFAERIAQRAQEIGVGGVDRAVHVELDNGLRFPDRVDVGGEIGAIQFLVGDIGCNRHHLFFHRGLDCSWPGSRFSLPPLPMRLYSAA